MGHIPVISINLSGLEENPGFKLSPALVLRGLYAAVFGDIFMKCVYRMRPYEAVPGTTDQVHRKWTEVVKKFVSEGYPSRRKFKKLCNEIIHDFDTIETLDIKKPRVGIVGEILVKFCRLPTTILPNCLKAKVQKLSFLICWTSCFTAFIIRISRCHILA